VKTQLRGSRQQSVRMRRTSPPKWQVPRRTDKPYGQPATLTVPLQNRFGRLREPESGDEGKQDLKSGRMPPQPRRLSRSRRTQAPPKFQAREVSPAKTERTRRVRVQPYGGSYYLSGKIADKAVTFLLDSGCTTNLLSRRVFDTLSTGDKAGLEPYQGEHGTLADGSAFPSTASLS